MDRLLLNIKNSSIGIIVFTVACIISLTLFIMGKCNVFYSSYDPYYDSPKDWIVIEGVSGFLSSYISYVIWIISISVFIVFFLFWLFFAILFFLKSKKLKIEYDIDMQRYALLNFFTFCVGAILALAFVNALEVEKNIISKNRIEPN